MKGRKTAYLFILILCILLTIGCGKKEVIFRTALPEMPENLLPSNTNYYAALINRNTFEPLFRAENNRVVPVLAESWYHVSDTHFVIKIKENILFSDGSMLTADDTKESLRLALINMTTTLARNINSIEAHDEFYVHIHYNASFDNLMIFLRLAPIYKVSAIEIDDTIRQKMLSTGEYVLSDFADDKIVLRKNKFHRDWRKNRRSPDIVEIFHEPDIDIRYQMLKNNDLDFLMNIPLSAYREVLYQSEVSFIEENSNDMLIMRFDVFRNFPTMADFPLAAIRDKNVRKAIIHAIDVRGFIENELYGKANLLVIPTLPRLQGYPAHLRYYEYDIEYSKALMAEAGYSEGFDLSIRVLEGRILVAFARFIQESLKQININVILEIYPTHEYYRSFDADIPSVYMTGVSNRTSTNIQQVLRSFSVNPNNRLILFEWHPQISNLTRSLNDLNEYDEMYPILQRQLADVVYEDLWILPFFEPLNIYVFNKNFSFNYSIDYRFKDFRIKR